MILKSNKFLKSLYINDIKIDESICKTLNDLLSNNKIIEEINLSNCCFEDKYFSIIKMGLTINNTLKVIQNIKFILNLIDIEFNQ